MTESFALIIAGHGSSHSAQSRAPICAAVKAFRGRAGLAEVRCALWKEEPFFAGALNRVSARRVVILPWFMARGYYTDVVMPREFASGGQGGREVRLADPIGTHPGLTELLLRRAHEVGFDGRQTLVILGHGTERNPESARTTRWHVERLAARGIPDVRARFLDQEPRLLSVFDTPGGKDLVVVPLFAADGWHVAETVPAELGLRAGHAERCGRRLRVSSAVGSLPETRELGWDLVIQAAQRFIPET